MEEGKEKRGQFPSSSIYEKIIETIIPPFDPDISLSLVITVFKKSMEDTARYRTLEYFLLVYNENCLMNQDFTPQYVGEKMRVHFTVVLGIGNDGRVDFVWLWTW